MREIKVNLHLIEYLIKTRRQNFLRYYSALRFQDINGSGKVSLDLISEVAKTLNVQPKTVFNYIFKLQKEGWGTIGGNSFYLASQDKIAGLYDIEEFSTKALYITKEYLGKLIDFRAFLASATLATKKPEGKTIARDTIKKLTGHTRKTQRKYEKITKTKKRFNFGVYGDYEGEHQVRELLYKEGNGVFVGVDPQTRKKKIMRQMPNSYFSNVQIGKRQYSTPHKRQGRGKGYASQRYFEPREKIELNDTTFIHDGKYKKLWYKIN